MFHGSSSSSSAAVKVIESHMLSFFYCSKMSLLFVGATVGFLVYKKLLPPNNSENETFETLASLSDFNKKRLEADKASPIRRNDSEFSLGLNKYDLEIQPGEFCKEGQVAFVVLKYVAIGTMLTFGGVFLVDRIMK